MLCASALFIDVNRVIITLSAEVSAAAQWAIIFALRSARAFNFGVAQLYVVS